MTVQFKFGKQVLVFLAVFGLGMASTQEAKPSFEMDTPVLSQIKSLGFLSPRAQPPGLDLIDQLDPLSPFHPPVPQISTQERLSLLSREDILKDPLHRVSAPFKVSPAFQQRVGFWLDIYTLYGAQDHVIHHSRYPWIIFEVVDTSEFLNGRGALWYRRQKGQNHVRARQQEIRRGLQRLAQRRSFTNLSPLEQHLFDQMEQAPGSRRAAFALASQSVRSQLGQKDYIKMAIRRSGKYLPYIEQEFSRQGLPIELTRIPIVESSFNERAQSRVGASGIWQIMPRTGQAYMRVNDRIDERNSPLKASRLAARLLRQYHRSLGSWELAITSYNHGVGNIRKAIREARSDDLATIIARYHRGHFRFASSNFYASFLAALYAERYQDVFFPAIAKKPLQEREIWTLTRSASVTEILKVTELTRSQLIDYNLDLRRMGNANLVLPRGFELHLPSGSGNPQLQKISRKTTPRSWNQGRS